MKILIIDDEDAMRHMLSVMLKKEGFDTVSASNGAEALDIHKSEEFDFILCDIRMPVLDGKGFLAELNKTDIDSTVIMMSAYGTIDSAIECMKLGAYDYISKPFKSDEILLTVKKAEERERLKKENARLKRDVGEISGSGEIYTNDGALKDILKLVKKVSDYDTTILIRGETGTGKELIARAVHYSGNRAGKAFVAVNCAAIPETLLESELFGHVKGAFTGADKTKEGLFKEADGGTIFLDEVGEVSKDVQVKLLRVLQEGEVRRVGDTTPIKVNVRVVSATVRDLEDDIKTGRFREDLYYRINVVPIALPPLRERQSDIAGLAGLFLERYSKKYGKNITGFLEESLTFLNGYSWPGNVRELENIVERAVILEDDDEISPNSLPITSELNSRDVAELNTFSIKEAEKRLEKTLIERALKETGGNKTRASKLLEISHRALLYKIKNYEL